MRLSDRRPAVVAVLASLVLLFTACGGPPGNGSDPEDRPAGSDSSSSTGDSTDAGSSGPVQAPDQQATARPTQPVPSVDVSGMVDPPPGEGMDRYTRQSLNWVDCYDEGEIQCASIRAPLDYDDPDGQAITLAVSRKRATSTEAKGTLFINPGGPGGSGLNYPSYFEGHGAEESYDIVGWDPRGVGQSTPVQCFDAQQLEEYTAFDYSPDDEQEIDALIELTTEFGQACLENSGQLLEHISTEDTVRDLDLLRQLFEQPELDYFGSSYGTSIGAMYATEFPDKVGRMVLDGATSVGTTSEVRQSDGFERTLGAFATWCAEENCPLGDSKKEVQSAIKDLLDSLDEEPIPGGRRDLTQALATSGLIYALYSPADTWPNLMMGLVSAIEDDDGTDLLRWADRYNQRDPDGEFGQFNASFPAIRCLDTTGGGVKGALKEWKQVQKSAPTIGQYFGPDLICPTWPVESTGDLERPISYDGDPPILILGTTGDPATPYEYAEQMHDALSSSRLVTLRAEGHLAFDQSECVQEIVVRHLVRDEAPKKDRTCRP